MTEPICPPVKPTRPVVTQLGQSHYITWIEVRGGNSILCGSLRRIGDSSPIDGGPIYRAEVLVKHILSQASILNAGFTNSSTTDEVTGTDIDPLVEWLCQQMERHIDSMDRAARFEEIALEYR